MLEPTRQSLYCSQPKHGPTLSHKMSKERKICQSSLHRLRIEPVTLNLYRATIKARQYKCYIHNPTNITLLHIRASIMSTYRLLLLVHFNLFSVTVRSSFRGESPVYSLTFVGVKRRRLDRRSSDLIKRIAIRL